MALGTRVFKIHSVSHLHVYQSCMSWAQVAWITIYSKYFGKFLKIPFQVLESESCTGIFTTKKLLINANHHPCHWVNGCTLVRRWTSLALFQTALWMFFIKNRNIISLKSYYLFVNVCINRFSGCGGHFVRCN